ncbi:MAG: alanine racemase, partial [Dehalococcoidia bacterium]|nr:alanine racemase [Dehalococcoidia bacterium]
MPSMSADQMPATQTPAKRPTRCPQASLNERPLWGAPYTDQTWVEIDCAALQHNLEQYRQALGPAVNLMPIVKANAYGHGLVAVSRELIGNGVNILGVVNINEALT